MELLKKRANQRRGRITALREEIAALEEKIANPPAMEDIVAINQDSAVLRQDSSGHQARANAIRERVMKHAELTGQTRAELKSHQQK